MLRPLFSYVLTSLVLLAQVGLPMHYHYCKGALESVSILFSKECQDDEMACSSAPLNANIPDCCKKVFQNHCNKEDNGCCHDQVKLLSQDLTSIVPGFIQWIPVILESNNLEIKTSGIVSSTITHFSLKSVGSDSGPPIYIRYHSLIYYA